MRDTALTSFLEPSNVFVKRRHIEPCDEPLIMFDVDISPYVQALNQCLSTTALNLFYVKLSRHMQSVDGVLHERQSRISSHYDIKDPMQMMCWMYYVQEYCL